MVILPTALPQPVQIRPRLAIPLGDPAGIGPEVVLKAAQLATNCDLTLVGNRSLLQKTYISLCDQLRQLGRSVVELADPHTIALLEVDLPESLLQQIQIGVGNAASGEAGFRFLQAAVAQTQAGQFDGIVTAPIAKSGWKAAGHDYPGQTEFLAEQAGVQQFGMLFVARSPHTHWTLRTLLATTHIPLRQVPTVLTPILLTQKLELLITCLRQEFGLEQPSIAISGLNPHSGEQGQLGDEEQTWLIPWLDQMRATFPQVQLQGPVPPDTLWVRPGQAWFGSGAASGHDAYLALYHDQGLIPVKLMAFDRAVNTTIGLPFVRTSPDHGTAFDIAGRAIAEATSFTAAIQIAVELVQHRQKITASKQPL